MRKTFHQGGDLNVEADRTWYLARMPEQLEAFDEVGVQIKARMLAYRPSETEEFRSACGVLEISQDSFLRTEAFSMYVII